MKRKFGEAQKAILIIILGVIISIGVNGQNVKKDIVEKGIRTIYIDTIIETVMKNGESKRVSEYMKNLDKADSVYCYTTTFYIKKNGKINHIKISDLDPKKDYKEIMTRMSLVWAKDFFILPNNIKSQKATENSKNFVKDHNIKKKTLIVEVTKRHIFKKVI